MCMYGEHASCGVHRKQDYITLVSVCNESTRLSLTLYNLLHDIIGSGLCACLWLSLCTGQPGTWFPSGKTRHLLCFHLISPSAAPSNPINSDLDKTCPLGSSVNITTTNQWLCMCYLHYRSLLHFGYNNTLIVCYAYYIFLLHCYYIYVYTSALLSLYKHTYHT